MDFDYQGVLFDVDGTLVDSNDQHALAFEQAFREFGYLIPFKTLRRLIGMGSDKLIPGALEREVSEEEIENIGKNKAKIFKEKFLSSVKPFPGSEALLRELSERKIKLGVASSAAKDELKDLLGPAGLFDFFAEFTSSDDAEQSKPAPDIVEAAIGKMKIPEKKLVMVGDTPYDVEAANRAGISIVGVRCGGWNDDALRGALEVVDGPTMLHRRWLGKS